MQRRSEHPGLGVSVLGRLCPSGLRRDLSVVWASVSSSARREGSLLGWRSSKPRTRIGVTLSLTHLACPALCQVPPHGHLDELRLSWLPFPVQETEAQTRVAIGLGKSRG